MKGEVTESMNQGNASGQDETVVGETGGDAPVGPGLADLISRTAEVRDPYARCCGNGTMGSDLTIDIWAK
jgi:hypothetical protein